MLVVAEALEVILSQIKEKSAEQVLLCEALERIIAEDIYSDYDIPAYDDSAMDGYAVRAEDTRGASNDNPVILEIVGEVKIGSLPQLVLNQGQAISVTTGGLIPSGADSVVIVEHTQREGSCLKIFRQVNKGDNIRKAGEDIKKGELILEKGIKISASHLGLLARIGKAKLMVKQKPCIAYLVTGDELLDLEEELKPGKVYNCNAYSLLGQILKAGAEPKSLGIVRDEPEDIKMALKEAEHCDIIITSGGVSMGKYDIIKDVLQQLGVEIKFHKVAVRPGKPLLFGIWQGKLLFALPGNPVSSMVSFEVFVKPAIFKMLGRKHPYYQEVEAVLDEDLRKRKGYRYFLRAITSWRDGCYHVHTTGPQGSGILKSMALANSLLDLAEEQEYIPAGSIVKVRFLN